MRAGRRSTAAELAAGAALAFSLPLLRLVAEHPAYFVARGAGSAEVVGVVLGCGVVPVVGAALLGWVLRGLGPRLEAAGRAATLAVLALLWSALLMAASGAGPPARGGGTLLLAGLLIGHRRSREVLRRFAPGLILAAGLFTLRALVSSPLAPLVLPGPRHALGVAAAAETPVVVLVLDELPLSTLLGEDGAIDPTRFPSLAALAATATWFREASSPHAFTSEALPALLTGRTVRREMAPVAANHPENLFTLLAPSHALRVVETATRLCPPELRVGGGAGDPPPPDPSVLIREIGLAYLAILVPDAWWRGRSPPVRTRWGEFAGPPPGEVADERATGSMARRKAAFERFMGHLEVGLGPTLYFHHTRFPHQPWRCRPDGSLHTPDDAEDDGGDETTEAGQRLRFRGHEMQARYADALVGRVLARLRARGLFRDSLIAVVADHGVAFTAGQEARTFVPQVADEQLGIPFLVKLPGQVAPRVSDRVVLLTDLLPTIAEVLEVEVPWELEGVSLVGAPDPDRFRIAVGRVDREVALPRKLARRAAIVRRNLRWLAGP